MISLTQTTSKTTCPRFFDEPVDALQRLAMCLDDPPKHVRLELLLSLVSRKMCIRRLRWRLQVRALELDARLQGQQADIVMMQQAVSQEAAESDRQNQGSEPSSRLEHVVLQVSQLQLHWFLSIHR